MVLLTRAIASLALLTLFAGFTWGMNEHVREAAMQAYRDWFPGSKINFQDGRYNDKLVPHLRELKQMRLLKVIEVTESNNHRHFIAPLGMEGSFDEFGLKYAANKNFFAAFRMPNDETSATFAGIGEINGPKRKDVAHKFAHEIESFTPLKHRIYLNIPE